MSHVAHGVQRIGDDDQDAIRGVFDGLLHGVLHDLVVGPQQVVAAHAGFARKPRGQDHNVGVGRRFVAVATGYPDIDSGYRYGFQDVQPFALRYTFHNVHHDHVGQTFVGQAHRTTGADIAGAHNRHFLSHIDLLTLMHYSCRRTRSNCARTSRRCRLSPQD